MRPEVFVGTMTASSDELKVGWEASISEEAISVAIQPDYWQREVGVEAGIESIVNAIRQGLRIRLKLDAG